MHEMKTKLQEPTVFHKTAATIPANKNQIVPHGADRIFFSLSGLIDRSPVSLLPVFSSVFHEEL